MPIFDTKNIELTARVVERFRALADENRIRILARLQQGPANVTTLTRELAVNQASVSKHLAVLRQAGLVSFHRQGAQAVYSISDPSVETMCKLVCEGVREHFRRQHTALQKTPR